MTLFDRLLKRLKHLRYFGPTFLGELFSLLLDKTQENRDRDAQKDEAKKEHDGIANRAGAGGIPLRNDSGRDSGKTWKQMAERDPHVRVRVSRSPRIAILSQLDLRPTLWPFLDISQLFARLIGAEARWNRSYRFEV